MTDIETAEDKNASPPPEKNDGIIAEYTETVTHDLNAPLRHIMQYGFFLKNEAGDRLGADGLLYLDRMLASARRLQRLVNDLSAFARIIHLKEERQELSLDIVFTEALQHLTPPIRETGARINISPLPVVSAFPYRMAQIAYHLIDNAIKYRSPEIPVVEVECVNAGEYWLFSVKDNGIGIAQEWQEAVFKALKRLHSQDDIDGSGLGLSICAAAIAAHGGGIWIASNPGPGLTVFFTLPKSANK